MTLRSAWRVYPKPDLDWGDIALSFALAAFTGPVGLATGLFLGLTGDEYRSWIITRDTLPLQKAERTDHDGVKCYYGHKERAGAMAGKGVDLGKEEDTGYFSNPCGTDNIIRREIDRAIGDLSDIREWAEAAGVAAEELLLIGGPLAIGAEAALQVAEGVILFTTFWIAVLSGIRELLPGEIHFGAVRTAPA